MIEFESVDSLYVPVQGEVDLTVRPSRRPRGARTPAEGRLEAITIEVSDPEAHSDRPPASRDEGSAPGSEDRSTTEPPPSDEEGPGSPPEGTGSS
jgi:hypothetical protein